MLLDFCFHFPAAESDRTEPKCSEPQNKAAGAERVQEVAGSGSVSSERVAGAEPPWLDEKLTVHPDIRPPGPEMARRKRFFSSPRTSTKLAVPRLHAAAVTDLDPPNSGESADARSVNSEACWGAASRSNNPAGRDGRGSEAELRAVRSRASRTGSRFGPETKSYQSIISSACD